MVHSKRLNVQKFYLGGTPRKVLYHSESRLLLILRTELDNDLFSSDICCVDPLSGILVSSFNFDVGETGKCMEFVRVGNDQILLAGTSLSSGPATMSSGEAERLVTNSQLGLLFSSVKTQLFVPPFIQAQLYYYTWI